MKTALLLARPLVRRHLLSSTSLSTNVVGTLCGNRSRSGQQMYSTSSQGWDLNRCKEHRCSHHPYTCSLRQFSTLSPSPHQNIITSVNVTNNTNHSHQHLLFDQNSKRRCFSSDTASFTEDIVEESPDSSSEFSDVYSNVDLRLDKVDVVGFDYDYTLADYTTELQHLIYDMAKELLVADKG